MRATIIVLDSVGFGALPDAHAWGDEGSDTIGHIAEHCGGLRLPNLGALGFGNIRDVPGITAAHSPQAAWGRAMTASDGKDTVTGHWEMAGCMVPDRFAFFPDGFPREVIEPFERATGRRVLGNVPSSGTVIIEDLGPEHMASGRPIVYTSADSVFQVAAHEDIVPLETLYDWCHAAFDLVAPLRVARVIARPFVGQPGAFQRTYNRKDFALEPHAPTVVDAISAAGLTTTGVGKIASIFAGRGFSRSLKAGSNDEVVAATLEALRTQTDGLVFSNLVDFDARYGHRRDPAGYGRALETFDAQVPELLASLGEGELLVILADHGCDPAFRGTDHTREYVPLLAWCGGRGAPLGTRDSLADVAATVAEWLEVTWDGPGHSFAAAF